MTDLFEWGAARAHDPDTSHAAARSIEAMAALLDRVPHVIDEARAGDFAPGKEPCHPDCPACAWARLHENMRIDVNNAVTYADALIARLNAK